MDTRLVTIATGAALVVGLLASPAAAQQNRPNANFLFGGDIFSSGQSDNIGPVANSVLEDYWVSGGCPDSNGELRFCDDLRFGMTMYPHADDGGACTVSTNELVRPHEDGGDDVETELQTIQNDAGTSYCDDPLNRPTHDGMYGLQSNTFDGTENDADSPWDRPNLNLTVVAEFPQEPDGSGGYNTTIKETVQASCDLLNGDDGNGVGSVPPMPTWVMVARKFDDVAVPFAGLASAAGGTGACCYESDATSSDPADCDPTGDDQIDVCSHISGRSEGVLKSNIENFKYNCGAGEGFVQVGQMAYPDVNSSSGIKKAISCHFAGHFNSGNGTCEDDSQIQDTDVLGKMACVRQLPRDYDESTDDLVYCDDAGNCTDLTDCSGEEEEEEDDCTATIEWVDPQKTMYVIVGEDHNGNKICDEIRAGDGGVLLDPCPNEGNSCTTGEPGRCEQGTIQCVGTVEYCQRTFDPMPEICNGLDDDCDGRQDNLSDSWDDFSYDPAALGTYDSDGVNREAIHCYERDVCRDVQDNSDSFQHVGARFSEYVMNWQPGIYVCGEGMSHAGSSSSSPQPTSGPDYEGAACSTSGDDQPVPFALLVIPMMAAGALLRRRR